MKTNRGTRSRLGWGDKPLRGCGIKREMERMRKMSRAEGSGEAWMESLRLLAAGLSGLEEGPCSH